MFVKADICLSFVKTVVNSFLTISLMKCILEDRDLTMHETHETELMTPQVKDQRSKLSNYGFLPLVSYQYVNKSRPN